MVVAGFHMTPETVVLKNTVIALMVVTAFFVFLRFVVRWKTKSRVLSSDWFMVASLVTFEVFCAVLLAAIYKSYGSIDIPEIAQHPDITFVVFQYVVVTTYLLGEIITLAKISILLFYRHIFTTRQFRMANSIVIGLCLAWWLATFFLLIFRCKPISGSWHLSDQLPGKCLAYGDVILGYEISNIVIDLLILLLPAREVMKLQMKTSKKIGVIAVFALGAFVVVTSIIRITVTYGYLVVPFTKTLLWTTIQPSMGIICGCLPCLPPLRPRSFTGLSKVWSLWTDSIRSNIGFPRTPAESLPLTAKTDNSGRKRSALTSSSMDWLDSKNTHSSVATSYPGKPADDGLEDEFQVNVRRTIQVERS